MSLLCEELGIFNGVVREDAAWDASREVEMALLFPFAPAGESEAVVADAYFCSEPQPAYLDWREMIIEPPTSVSSSGNYNSMGDYIGAGQPPAESLEGYESMRESEYGDEDAYVGMQASRARDGGAGDVEGIYRFLSECEGAPRR